MRPRTGPALSVILVTDRFETIRRVVSSLVDQSGRERIELVVAVSSEAELDCDQSLVAPLHGVRVVETGAGAPMPRAKAAAIRAATAPVVFLGETHAYPRPGFVEALLEAHARGFAAVAPAVGNGNPGDGALSWAALLTDYGSRLPSVPGGEIAKLQSYNVSVRREVLAALDPDLEVLLAPSEHLGVELRRAGYRLLFEPRARVDHLNVSQPRAWVAERFLGGRLLAEARVRRWPLRRRVLYAAGSPLIPVVSLARVLRTVDWPRRRRDLPRLTLPALTCGAVVWAAGELAGYLWPRPGAETRMEKYEVQKVRYVSSRVS